MNDQGPIIKLREVFKEFAVGSQMVQVLKGIDLSINPGDFFIIFGPSGSGKSTVLHTILGLEKPTSGQVEVMGKNFERMAEDDIANFRKYRMGTVYQQSYWIKSLNVLENVSFPMFLLGHLPNNVYAKAVEMLKIVGMEAWKDYYPSELSAGQQQKISLARALMNDPLILIADEPTGNLDTKSGEELMMLLADLNKTQKRTVVMVTHDLEYLKYATRMVRIVDGKVDNEYDRLEIEQIFAGNENQGKRGSKRLSELEAKENEIAHMGRIKRRLASYAKKGENKND